jgi:hypothetical protein
MLRPCRLLFCCLVLVGFVSGCSDRADNASVPQAAVPAPAQERRAASNLAYEHSVSIEGDADFVRERFARTRDACLEDEKFGCHLLHASLSTGDYPQASLRMRIAAAGVAWILEAASAGGEIRQQVTSAEDLTAPVQDTERQLQMMTRHRARLEELQGRRDLNVDQLIRLSQELAEVQTSIEGLTAAKANLQRRIDTELLTVNFTVPSEELYAQRTPVRDALRSFVSLVAEGTGSAIETIAVGLPWLLFVFVPSFFLVRWAWRFTRRRSA